MKHQVRKWLQCILQKNKSCSMMLWSSMRLCLQWLKVLYILRIDVETLKCSIRRTVPEAQGDEVLCFVFHLFHSIWSVITISFTETCPFFKGSDNFCFKNPSWKKRPTTSWTFFNVNESLQELKSWQTTSGSLL